MLWCRKIKNGLQNDILYDSIMSKHIVFLQFNGYNFL